jgi:hypothetical protein
MILPQIAYVRGRLQLLHLAFTMRRVALRRKHFLFAVIALLLFIVGWLYWNRRLRTDLSSYAPADALGFIEVNDLSEIANGITETQAWKSLAGPIGSPGTLAPNRWLIRLAQWTGIGSTDTILFARSQVAIVFGGAEGTQAGSTLVIKPLTTFIIDTHTSQRRMRSTVERHIEELARRLYQNPVFVRKQIAGNDFQEWQSADGSHVIVFAFADTAVLLGNNETSVLHSLETHTGQRASLTDQSDLSAARQIIDGGGAPLFGYVTQPGIKSLLQGFALYRSGSSADAVTGARIFSDTMGGLVKSISWTSRFADGGIEDHCSIVLSDGVADKLRGSMVPDRGPDVTRLLFVPTDIHSLSFYQFRDANAFWSDLNATVSAHTDLIGAVAARPMLRALVRPYGIDDADTFARAIGPRIQTVRLEKDSPAVLIAEVFDRQALRKAIAQRFGANPEIESVGDAELLISKDNWAAAFLQDSFLIGPAELVRKCLQARAPAASSSPDRLRQTQNLIDVSLPLTSVTFTDDRQAAISFVEAFSKQDRPAFATNASTIDGGARSLPFAVSVSLLKGPAIDWTSRSSFGVVGWLATELMSPPQSR